MPDLRATKELKTKQRSSSVGHPGAREGLELMLEQKEGGALAVEICNGFHPQRLKVGLFLPTQSQHQPPESILATCSREERGYEIEGDCDLSTS